MKSLIAATTLALTLLEPSAWMEKVPDEQYLAAPVQVPAAARASPSRQLFGDVWRDH